MLYAELRYDQHYSDMHDPILAVVQARFDNVEHGHQGDSWIWIHRNGQKVAIDTFSSMLHEVKADAASAELAADVIEVLSVRFEVRVLPEPELEPHEDG